jgi:chorismate synthase
MNEFGRLFRVGVFGESRGECVGALVDGCPAGIRLRDADFAPDMARRMPGARGTTARREPDQPHIASGVHKGRTTGAPILILIGNEEAQSVGGEERYSRPGHADLAAAAKFGGRNDPRGGGHFSGRLTAPLVAAGVVAKKIAAPVSINAELAEAGGSKNIKAAVAKAVSEGDSLGGIIECRISRVPAGLGEPFFDSVESRLSHIIFSIPGVKGVEFGKGFACSGMRGSAMNALEAVPLKARGKVDASGGIHGGMTSGSEISFRVAVRPASSLAAPTDVVDVRTGRVVRARLGGRNDACFALRLPVVVEAAAAIVLADLMLLAQARPRIMEG